MTSPFGQPFRLGPETLELFPSGHLLGGAQVRVEHDGSFVLYCGTLCTSALPTVEAAQPVRADYVVAQARCLPSDADIPSRASVEGQIGDFVERTLSAGDTPVLLSEELGSAQDLLATLVRRGLPVAAHRSVSRYLSAYVDAGVSALKSVKKPARRLLPAHAFVCPPEFLGTELLRGMSGIRTAWVGLHAPQGVDEVFPLTNLSSAQDIVEHVRSCVPVRVLFVGPHDVRLAILAQQEGLDASALSRSGQLNLSIP